MLEELWSKFEAFSDEQRLERLRACEDLAACVINCRKVRKSRLLGKDEHELINMELCVPGIRMVKYFDWRESKPTRVQTDEPNQQQVMFATKNSSNEIADKKKIPTCARETHSMWGCRAVALGCSEHMISLRDCFRDSYTKDQVLNVANFAYESDLINISSSKKNETIPCREIQENLGKCVSTNASILEQRITKRKQK